MKKVLMSLLLLFVMLPATSAYVLYYEDLEGATPATSCAGYFGTGTVLDTWGYQNSIGCRATGNFDITYTSQVATTEPVNDTGDYYFSVYYFFDGDADGYIGFENSTGSFVRLFYWDEASPWGLHYRNSGGSYVDIGAGAVFSAYLEVLFNDTHYRYIKVDGTEYVTDTLRYSLGGDFEYFTLFGDFASGSQDLRIDQVSIYTYELPKVNITLLEEDTGTLITETITAEFTNTLTEEVTSGTSSGGYIYVENLSEANYTVSLSGENYSSRTLEEISLTGSIFGTVTNYTSYLVPSSSSATVFTFQDRDDATLLEGVTLTVQKKINSTWTTINVLSSDITGRTSFKYLPETEYRFFATVSDYLGKNWTLNPILFSSYVIKMDKDSNLEDNTDFSGISIIFEPQEFVNNQSHGVNFTFSSPYGEFTSYGFNATFGATVAQDSGSNAYGSVLSDTLIINGADFGDTVSVNFYYTLNNGVSKTFTRNFLIINATTLGNWKDSLGNHYGMGLLERVIIAVGLTLLVAGAGAYFGSGIAGGVVGVFLLGLWGYTGFLPWWSVLISITTMFIILLWRSSQ